MFYQLKENELERLLVIKQVKSRSPNQKEGALKLGVTARQLRRIMHRYKHEGTNVSNPGQKVAIAHTAKNFELSFNGNLYKVKRQDAGRRYSYAEVDVFESPRAELTVLCRDEILEFGVSIMDTPAGTFWEKV